MGAARSSSCDNQPIMTKFVLRQVHALGLIGRVTSDSIWEGAETTGVVASELSDSPFVSGRARLFAAFTGWSCNNPKEEQAPSDTLCKPKLELGSLRNVAAPSPPTNSLSNRLWKVGRFHASNDTRTV
eukprot:2258476-Pyramimonas_sp.AAC.1